MTVYVFDFDGVVCHQMGEAIYRLEPYEDENAFLDKFIADEKVPVYQNRKYQRHVVMEQLWLGQGRTIAPGPYADFVYRTEKKYILTARSSPHAVFRASQFLITNSIKPLECFFVGSAGKLSHLEWICDHHKDEEVIFMDDTARHIENANQLKIQNLTNILVPDSVHPEEARKYYESCWR